MAPRIKLSLDEDVVAEAQREADSRPFEIRAKDLYARPGFNLDNIEELLEQAEGSAHR